MLYQTVIGPKIQNFTLNVTFYLAQALRVPQKNLTVSLKWAKQLCFKLFFCSLRQAEMYSLIFFKAKN